MYHYIEHCNTSYFWDVAFMTWLQVYENMKAKAKKALSTDKVERFKTGGGIFKPTVDTIDEQLISLMGNRATPLENPFDSDYNYTNSTCNNNIIDNVNNEVRYN